MPPRSPEALRKVTLNLFEKDCAAMERHYGHGWSEQVRTLVREHLERRLRIRQAIDTFLEEDQDGQ